MRVAWIIDHLGQGGTQRQLLEVGRLLRDQVSLQVVSLSTRKTDYAAPLREAGIQLTLVPQGSKFSFLSTCQALATILSQSQPDIVQTWLFEAGVYGRLAALWTRRPVVVAAVRNTTESNQLATCIASVVSDWTFEPFSGESIEFLRTFKFKPSK